MTLLLNNWTLASFSLTVLSSPYWPWMPPLGLALLCPLLLMLCMRLPSFRLGTGIVLAVVLIITHSSTVKMQSVSIFKAGQNITIKGEVDSFFKQISFGYEGSVSVREVNGQAVDSVINPHVRLFSPVSMQIGDEYEFFVTVKPVIGRLNEVGFDMESYYMSQGWVARAFVQSGSSFRIISKPSVRALIHQRVKDLTLDSPYQGMILALVFGERTDVSQSLWQKLRDSGLIHLVAISGLHIGIAFGFGYLLGVVMSRLTPRLLWLPFILGSICAIGYAWLAGFTLPTQRALVMCLLNVFVVVAGIQLSLVQKILLTLSVVLIVDPFAPLVSSFWLSFFAVCLVLYLTSATDKQHNKWYRLLVMQFWVVLLMAPLSGYIFGGISWSAIGFNLVFIPWFSMVVVPLLFIAVITSSFSFPYTDYLWSMVDRTFEPLMWVLDYLPSGWIATSQVTQNLLFFLIIAWFARTLLSRYTLAVYVLIIVGSVWFKQSAQQWRMDVLDVGHGLAVLIEKNGQFLLYDTGSSWPQGSYVRSLIVPLLAKRGVTNLNSVIYSHLDNDHAGGRKDVDQLLSPSKVYSSQSLENGVPCIRGQNWYWQGLSFSVLWPPKQVDRAFNQHSCVIRIEDQQYGHSILLSGDVTAVGEWLLARDNVMLHSDVMLVPHHGSKTSSTQRFIQRVNPEIAIASLAKGNQWNLPHADVVERYHAQGVKWLDTGETGQITMQYRSETRHLSTMRQDGITPWYRQTLRKEVE